MCVILSSHCYQLFFDEIEDWTGKMDPYVIVRSGGREFRTPVMTNAGRKPKFNWAQMVDWRGEPDIHFIVMDSNFMVADGLIGEAVYKGLPLHSDFKGQECTESRNSRSTTIYIYTCAVDVIILSLHVCVASIQPNGEFASCRFDTTDTTDIITCERISKHHGAAVVAYGALVLCKQELWSSSANIPLVVVEKLGS